MNLELNMEGLVLVVKLDGEIDHHTSVEIRECIDREYQKRRAKSILFDFRNVSFMDSSGIGLLMGRFKNVNIAGGRIGLLNVSGNVDKVLSLSGLYKLMKAYETRDDALNQLA